MAFAGAETVGIHEASDERVFQDRFASPVPINKKGQACFRRLAPWLVPMCLSGAYFLPLGPNSSAPHFLAVASSTSLLDSATGGKSFIHS